MQAEEERADGLKVGSRGWEVARWDETFYPETLPEAWRLVYYANEFRTVLIPDAVWRSAGAPEVAGWIEETNEAFRPWLEVTGEPDEALDLVERAGERLAGVLLGGEACAGGEDRFPTGLVVRRLDRSEPERGVWRPGAGRGFTVGIADARSGDLRRLRGIVEAFLDPAVPDQTLFLEGVADPALLHRVEVIAALLSPSAK